MSSMLGSHVSSIILGCVWAPNLHAQRIFWVGRLAQQHHPTRIEHWNLLKCVGNCQVVRLTWLQFPHPSGTTGCDWDKECCGGCHLKVSKYFGQSLLMFIKTNRLYEMLKDKNNRQQSYANEGYAGLVENVRNSFQIVITVSLTFVWKYTVYLKCSITCSTVYGKHTTCRIKRWVWR